MAMLRTRNGVRWLVLLATAIMIAAMLAGCQTESKDLSLSITIKNETEYEIQEIIFHTYGNRPYFFTIVDMPLPPGEERQVDVELNWTEKRGEENQWFADAKASDAESRYDATEFALNENVKGYVIFYNEKTDFVFTPFYE